MKETKQFETESRELLNLMINSIYSNHEVFLRELISNASDAIDKYRYVSLNSDGKIPVLEGEINISIDKKNKTITISDNGIGMSKKEIISNLGTIARSGSKDFLKKFKEAKDSQDVDIIGQFGVGFYSAFMVASKVEVISKKYDSPAYKFTSDGKDSYTIEEVDKADNGTDVIIYLKKSKEGEDYDSYLEDYRIKELVKKYSDYIRYPIKMMVKKSRLKKDKDGKDIEGKYEDYSEIETLNSMVPIWKKNKSEVKDEELNEFYKSKFQDYEDPLLNIRLDIEGKVNYQALVFIPSHQPYNLYSENYEKGLQLYSKGVFIKDKCAELVPDYLKFIKGLVDSDAFNLNISREILQTSPVLKVISENLEKKVISKLKDLRKNDEEKFIKFWNAFGEHIKYGVYSTYGMKKDLLQDLLVFHSFLKEDKLISLEEYVKDMKEDQKYIYYISGSNLDSIKLLPQLEKYKKNGVDVLLLDQKIDEFAIMMLQEYEKKQFKSIASDEVDELSEEEKQKIETITVENKRLLDNLKSGLENVVDDVVISSKLVDAPVCISTKDGLSLEMEKTLNEQKPAGEEQVKSTKVLELNPNHELFKAFSSAQEEDELVKELASVLYDEALLLEGYDIANKQEFVKKLNEILVRGIKK